MTKQDQISTNNILTKNKWEAWLNKYRKTWFASTKYFL